jgi:hypothetical protein
VALLLAKSLADFRQSQAKTKVVCTQHTKHGTAEPFHFIHMGPMSDDTMLRRPCVAYLEAPCPCGTVAGQNVWQISARAKPKPRLFAPITPSMASMALLSPNNSSAMSNCRRWIVMFQIQCSDPNKQQPYWSQKHVHFMYKQLCQMKCSAYPKEMFWTGSG